MNRTILTLVMVGFLIAPIGAHAAITGESTAPTGQLVYSGFGGGVAPGTGSDIGAGRYTLGDCQFAAGVTTCTLSGNYVDAADSDGTLGGRGTFSFRMTYTGNGPTPALARSRSASDDSVQFYDLGGAVFTLDLFPSGGGQITAKFPASATENEVAFGAFLASNATCTGTTVTSCRVGQVGLTPGATISGAVSRFAFSVTIRQTGGVALENPAAGSFQSGIGLISGWICSAIRIDIDVDGLATVQAAYGTLRGDTQSVCGDSNNGYGFLINWNLLGNGSHRVRVFADGGVVASATFTVTTLGLGDFARGLSGASMLDGFPQSGRITRVQWQESAQNFVITPASGSGQGGGSNAARTLIENPASGSFQSGIGLISGWACDAIRIDIDVDGRVTGQAAYGTLRGDTQSVCGDSNNGYGFLINWNLLGDGTHFVRVLADGVEVGRSTFTVTTLGLGDFPRGLSGTFSLQGFPQAGKTTQIQWQESQQNFVIIKVQ
jgi:hypothetical protein